MKRKVIIGLTAATVVVGSYAVIHQYGNNVEVAQEVVPPLEPVGVVVEPNELVAKEVLYLNAEEITSIEKSRDPFQTPQVVADQFERREKQYEALKAKIEKRVAELREEQARKDAAAQGIEYVEEEKPFEEILQEEIEKIINASMLEFQQRPIDRVQSVSSGSPTTDKDIIKIAAEQAEKNDVDSRMILAIIGSKTSADGSFEVRDENGTSNRGLMQINTTTAKWLAGLMGIPYRDGMEFDNEQNISLGAYYLGYLKKQNTDPHYIITAYYIGPNGAERHKKQTGSYASDFSNIIMGRMK